MGRPTLLAGWWLRVCEELAGGKIDVLANLFEVNPRTLNRWAKGEILSMHETRRKQIRKMLGKALYDAQDSPKYLKTRKTKKV